MYGATIGKLAIVDFPFTVNQACCVFTPRGKISVRFLLYSLLCHREHIISCATGGGQPNINQEFLRALRIAVPGAEEQASIVAFLDRETAKIDALVDEQKRLIELLKEKCQAVISHAVTKGLDPNAPMKDSGVEWLGQVPEHWEVRRVKDLATPVGRIGFRGYTTADIVDEGEGAISLSPGNFDDGKLSLDRSVYVSWEKYEQSPEIMVHQHDVIMVKTGSSYGKVCFVDIETAPPMTINPQLLVFKNIRCENMFLYFCLLASHVVANIKVSNSGGSIPTMTQENIGNLCVLVPPSDEQTLIVTHLKEMTAQINRLTECAVEAIALLLERRSALISAAVTGKIDMRGVAAEIAEAAA